MKGLDKGRAVILQPYSFYYTMPVKVILIDAIPAFPLAGVKVIGSVYVETSIVSSIVSRAIVAVTFFIASFHAVGVISALALVIDTALLSSRFGLSLFIACSKVKSLTSSGAQNPVGFNTSLSGSFDLERFPAIVLCSLWCI